MMEIFINPLSAHGQFSDANGAERAVNDLIECFELARPGFHAETIALFYDGNMERRGLRPGSGSLTSCLNALVSRDLRNRWYFYTRRARTAIPEFEDVRLDGDGETLIGEGSGDLLAAKLLASLGGSPACKAERVELRVGAAPVTACDSFYELRRFKGFLPRYEHNPKHRLTTYTRAGGEVVAPMTVGVTAAQAALLAAIDDGHGHRFGLAEGKFLKFVLTVGVTFHAYEVAGSDMPIAIRDALIDRL